MNVPSPADRFQNPFSASRVRPGAAPFLFPAGEDSAALVEQLELGGWRGEIVGPHGSGKSTLLAALSAELAARGRQTFSIALHDGERRLPVERRQLAALASGTLVIVDGYEQLSWWSRWRLGRMCASRGWGLLVTAHRPVGLPQVARAPARRRSWPRELSIGCCPANRRSAASTWPSDLRHTKATCVSCCSTCTIFTNRAGRAHARKVSSRRL